MIVVTYDEAYPPFTWQNSFANSTLLPSTAYGSLITDQAGETLYGRSSQLGADRPEPARGHLGHRSGPRPGPGWWRQPRSPDGDAGRNHRSARGLLQRDRR